MNSKQGFLERSRFRDSEKIFLHFWIILSCSGFYKLCQTLVTKSMAAISNIFFWLN